MSVEPQVLSSLTIMAGTMVAALRLTRRKLWEAHKQCPRCGASLPGGLHAENCDLGQRL